MVIAREYMMHEEESGYSSAQNGNRTTGKKLGGRRPRPYPIAREIIQCAR